MKIKTEYQAMVMVERLLENERREGDEAAAKSLSDATQGWIPVGERLPPPHETVAVAAGKPYPHRFTGFVNRAGTWFVQDAEVPPGYVNHWFALRISPNPTPALPEGPK